MEVMSNIEDNSIDMILCDLPYGTTNCKWDCPLDLKELWKHYKRVAKENAAIVLFAQTPFDKVLGFSNLDWLRYEWIWEKTNATGFLNANKMPMKAHENILVFYAKMPKYFPQKTFGHKKMNSWHTRPDKKNKTQVYGNVNSDSFGGGETTRFPRSVQTFASDKQLTKLQGTIHPTQKPVALCEYLIKTYTEEGDVVLDNCAGSGTTGVACKNLNRNFILIEKEKEYYDLILRRLDLT